MDKLSDRGEKKTAVKLDEEEAKSEIVEAVDTKSKKGVHFNDDTKRSFANRLQEEASTVRDNTKVVKFSNIDKEGGVELDEEVEGEAKSEMVKSIESKSENVVHFSDEAKQGLVNHLEGETGSENNISDEIQSNASDADKPFRKLISIPSDLIIQADCLTIGKKIGIGGFSEVFAATYKWQDGTDSVALKSIKLESAVCSKKEIEGLEREIMLLRSFRIHENVVTILGACSDVVVKNEKGKEVDINLGLMMEISHTGSLFDYLQDPNSAISSQFCFYTSFDIANGLLALHSHSDSPIIHRDIKSLNVLLFPSNSRQGFIAKIADFGLARMKKVSTLKATKKTGVGSPNWLPPESYDGSYKEESDVWEFGMVMYEIASRCIPYEGCQDNEIMKKVVLNRDCPDLSKVKKYFPEDLLVVMKGCWIYEAEHRPDFYTIVGILTDKLKENGLVISKKKQKTKSEESKTVEDRMNFLRSLKMIEEQLKRQAGQDSVHYSNAWMGLELDTNTPLLLENVSRLASSYAKAPSQPHRLKSLNDIIFDAQTCNKMYHQAIQPLVENSGGTYVSGKIKDRERCTTKVEKEYDGDARRLVDVVRGAGVFESCTDMLKMVQAVENSSTISIIRCKDRLNKPLDSGYRDLILNISVTTCTDSEPHVAELQLRLKPIHDYYAQSHRTYEIQRIMPDVQANQSKAGGSTFWKCNKQKKLLLFVLICMIVALTTGLIAGLQTNKENETGSSTPDAGTGIPINTNSTASNFPSSSPSSCYHTSVKLAVDDGSADDQFGNHVAVSDGIAVVGAPGYQDSMGAAYIFKKSIGGLWSQETKLVPKDGSSGIQFGVCVATSGGTVVIGADSAENGAVYSYEKLEDGLWTQMQKLSADSSKRKGFGHVIAISDGDLAVGASDTGGVNIYEKSESGNWTEVQALDKPSEGFGRNGIGISYGTIVVGDDTTQNAYVYQKIADVWVEVQVLRPSDVADGDKFGTSVGVHDDNLVVSSHEADDSGKVYIYERVLSGEWVQSEELFPDGNINKFGIGAVVSKDTIVVGAYSGSNTAYIFEKAPGGNWIRVFREGAFETRSVGISIPDGAVLLGAPSDDNEDITTGAVYFVCHTPMP